MPEIAVPTAAPPIEPVPWEPWPEIDLRQLLRMTDDTGIFQHAIFGMPDPNHGYCIDDNARALIAGLLHAQLRGYDERVVPVHRYLTFLTYAFNEQNGTFRNFMSYDRRWLEDEGSHDSQGRTLWTLGLTVRLAPQPGMRELARTFLHRGLPAAERFEYLRSCAFALLGLDEYLKSGAEDPHPRELRDRLAERLLTAYQAHATEGWPWWEDVVTYDNAKLSHALIVAGQAMRRPDMIDAGLASLRWLLEIQTSPASGVRSPESRGEDSGLTTRDFGLHLSIIGNDGWLRRGGTRAAFDQQPLEAYAMVHACLAAAEVTGDEAWAHHAWWCFEWFRGRNDLGVPLYNPHTGGCFDGLIPTGVNANQGAESVLAYLLSVLELHRYHGVRTGHVRVKSRQTVGYAVVGASSFAGFCLDQYRGIDGFAPVAVWSRTRASAEKLATAHKLNVHAALDDLLADPAVQLVHVASTPATHADLATRALQAGKHVLCEKPLATDAVDAQRMIATATERDRVLAVNFMMRFGPLQRTMESMVAGGVLGALVRGGFTNRAGDAGLPPGHWFWDAEQSGGIFIEHGVHTFDLVRSWLGRPGQVSYAQQLRRPGGDVVDQAQCEVRYALDTGPVTVDFYHGFLQPSPLDQQEFRLVFERGSVVTSGWIPAELSLHAVVTDAELESLVATLPTGDLEVTTVRRFVGGARQLQHRGRVTEADAEVRVGWRDRRKKQAIYGDALRALMEDAVAAIRDRHHAPRVTAADGLAAVQVAAEATRLAKTTAR